MRYREKSARAKSNVRAACKIIGVVGVLDQLAALLLQNAVQFVAGSDTNDHYTRLSLIIQQAQERFRRECDRYDSITNNYRSPDVAPDPQLEEYLKLNAGSGL